MIGLILEARTLVERRDRPSRSGRSIALTGPKRTLPSAPCGPERLIVRARGSGHRTVAQRQAGGRGTARRAQAPEVPRDGPAFGPSPRKPKPSVATAPGKARTRPPAIGTTVRRAHGVHGDVGGKPHKWIAREGIDAEVEMRAAAERRVEQPVRGRTHSDRQGRLERDGAADPPFIQKALRLRTHTA